MTKEVKTQSKEAGLEKYVRDKVARARECGAIDLPDNYSVENAINQASMVIGEAKAGKNHNYKPALEVCDPQSVIKSMYAMVTDGLTPFKNQCAFIVRGDKLVYQREYMGSIALAKRFSGVKRVDYQVVYSEDKVVYNIENGILKVSSHERGLKRTFDDIIGAYCIITEADGTLVATEMTMEQIQKAWEQGDMKGNSPAHKNFKDQMVLKTVINRACKPYINSSDDSSIVGNEDVEYKAPDVDSVEEPETLEIKVEEVKKESVVEAKVEQPEKQENKKKKERGF